MISKIFAKYWFVLLAIFSILFANKLPLRINLTSSMPQGIYLLEKVRKVNKNDFVMICLNNSLTNTAFHLGYLHAGTCANGTQPLLKQVVGLENDVIAISSNAISINNIKLSHSATLSVDTHHRPLTAIPRGIYILKANQLWLYGNKSEHSWDSRYFGIANLSQVMSIAKPLLIWG